MRPASPRDVLGVPFMPPGSATMATNRLRDAVGRLHRTMAPPPVRILESLFGLLEHRVLVALCELDVPDAIDRPVTMTELAARTGSDPERLERLVRFAATRGWLRIDRRGRVRATRTTRFLRRDHPGGWRGWVEFAGGADVVGAVHALGADPAVTDVFRATHGASFFEWMAAHPDRGATFDRAMAAGGRMHALGLAAAVDWSGTHTICDVGGGTGDLIATLLDRLPQAHGIVLDLPQVTERAVAHPRLVAVAGDAFESVPPGCDTYLLVNVLHDWNDEDATRLLARVADAMASEARVIVVESEHTARPRADMAMSADVLMAALTPGGKERDTAGFTMLAERAGLTHQRSARLASGDLALTYRKATQ